MQLQFISSAYFAQNYFISSTTTIFALQSKLFFIIKVYIFPFRKTVLPRLVNQHFSHLGANFSSNIFLFDFYANGQLFPTFFIFLVILFLLLEINFIIKFLYKCSNFPAFLSFSSLCFNLIFVLALNYIITITSSLN